MTFIANLRRRHPKLYRLAAATLTVGTIAGVHAWEHSARASDSCCYPGSPCCYAGSPCCGQRHAQK